MKYILLYIFSFVSLFAFSLGNGVTIDSKNNTITKNEKTYNAFSGAIYITDDQSDSDLIVAITNAGAFADIFTYISDDSASGLYLVESEIFADYTVYITDIEMEADIIIKLVEAECLAGIRKY